MKGAAGLNHAKTANKVSQKSSSDAASKCKTSLVQIAGPAHIPLQDIRWQDLFLSYEILVHLSREHDVYVPHNSHNNPSHQGGPGNEIQSQGGGSFITQICERMAKHTYLSCNLAGLTWHVTAMMNELIQSCNAFPRVKSRSGLHTGAGSVSSSDTPISSLTTPSSLGVAGMGAGNASLKIALVGKARVVCGAMNLYRILVHEALVKASRRAESKNDNGNGGQAGQNENAQVNLVKNLFLFQSRNGGSDTSASEQDMAPGMISALLAFIATSVESKEMQHLIHSTPELYDVCVFCLDLIVVLCSTQLYQPIVSSFQRVEYDEHPDNANLDVANSENILLDLIMREASRRQRGERGSNKKKEESRHWSPQEILNACLYWMVDRPPPPQRSIANHFKEMAEMVAQEVKNEKLGPDGMYENYAIVMANAPDHIKKLKGNGSVGNDTDNGTEDLQQTLYKSNSSSTRIILDSTKKMIHISSSLLLLPIRLLTIALRALGQSQKLIGSGKGNETDSKLVHLQALYGHLGGVGNGSKPSPTNDVLWLSDSPLADLGSTLFLLVANNNRAGVLIDKRTDEYVNNPFRVELASLDDNRWDGYSQPGGEDAYLGGANDIFQNIALADEGGKKANGALHHYRDPKQNNLLMTNFEHLFESFGGTLHNEVGSLVLYTLLQASPIFAASLAVRSDLDKLVIPLLRTLYYSSSTTHYISGRTATDSSGAAVVEQPFRSRSQLYLIMILLLIFSQDTSFGPDSFRRSKISNVEWYKERTLKDVSLGSLLILSLLRCITFNLNRLQDPFLLSNCCAVLLNLSPHAVELHSYTSMRLISVLIATMKRYTLLVMKNGGRPAEEGDVSSMLGMYAEACRILLQIVKQGVRRKVVEKNLDLVYALVYYQRDFNTILKAKCKFELYMRINMFLTTSTNIECSSSFPIQASRH